MAHKTIALTTELRELLAKIEKFGPYQPECLRRGGRLGTGFAKAEERTSRNSKNDRKHERRGISRDINEPPVDERQESMPKQIDMHNPACCSGHDVCMSFCWSMCPTLICMTVCPSGLRGWTQVPLARAAWVRIPQLSGLIKARRLLRALCL